ncbi:class I SAM-dependent methyltransferase [Phormidium sp. LEGE 05292]|uniref:class I SAM-dependent methyltransferase n=1 Tax=[Phormidium] sp. LEGE 05292 TaxID=767427 RepID=UPI001882C70A|nr:class I SAM-dependent methyltransferase [Phormidium sp. LEGE 05292]MBE9227339.1 class I SAM-dependent methyltransferase [Phormidium sp. LEGE 05292]
MSKTNYSYVGNELELFRYATNWKAYYSSMIQPFLGKEVLEVGAGIGATTELLCKGKQARWLCLEPDAILASDLNSLLLGGRLPKCCDLLKGTLLDLSETELFDSIVYIDVLEHIKDDRTEVELAASHLKPGGFLIVLSPAHQWLFTPFDAAIGHYRRYNKSSLSAVIPGNLQEIQLQYLDSVGLIASLANKLILKSKMPTLQQIKIWDKKMVPLSKIIDPLLKYYLGKSIMGIWQKID